MSFKLRKYFKKKDYVQLFLEAVEYKIAKGVSRNFRAKLSFINALKGKKIEPLFRNDRLDFRFLINQKEFTFSIRDNSSDAMVFEQIFFNHEYKAIVELFEGMHYSPKIIIDAGANVGFSTIYLAAYLPGSDFICLEPFPTNFWTLRKNIELNNLEGRCVLLQKALWNKETALTENRDFRDGLDWSFSVKEGTGPGKIEALSITEIIKQHKLSEIDFLKMDIEGAEAELFNSKESVAEWINLIRVLAVEIHEEQSNRFYIENLLQEFDFRIFHSGEITIAVKRNLLT